MRVAIAALVTRELPIPEKVETFRKILLEGRELPPVRVMRYQDAASGNDRRRWYLYDGHHRVAAARAAGRAYVEATLVSLVTEG
jgi:hypothetical protein